MAIDMQFEAERKGGSITLDGSIPIYVRANGINEEYIFQFALNEKEIKDLMQELEKALKTFREMKRYYAERPLSGYKREMKELKKAIREKKCLK